MNAAAPATPYAMIGEEAIGRIVNRFYDLVESDPQFDRLRAMHGSDLGSVRHGLHRFMAGWLGGPRDWFDRGQCIMGLHRVFAIDADLAGQWSKAMRRAIEVETAIGEALRARMADALDHMAHAMVRPAAAAG